MDKSVERVDKPATQQHPAKRPNALRPVLGIFAKEPVAGQVKTRLSPPLSMFEAADLYRVMLEETVASMRRGSFDLLLCYAGREDYFLQTFPGVPLLPQSEGDLGRRLEQALGSLLERGHPAAVLIGSDSPDLPPAMVEEALAHLTRADCVTAPAGDGGYVLIGERRHAPELFFDIPWSTPQVLAATRHRATELGIDYRELAPWDDVDDLVSLEELLRRSPLSTTTAFVLTQLKQHFNPAFACLPGGN